jgi:hypothetical protein
MEHRGHVEQIWWRRNHDTWSALIQTINGDRWAWGESDPLEFYEEVCVEWAACLMESLAGTWLVVSAFLTPSLLRGHHHATALRHVVGIEGMPSQYPKASFSYRWLIGGLRAILSTSIGAIKRALWDAAPSIPPPAPSILHLRSNSRWTWRWWSAMLPSEWSWLI